MKMILMQTVEGALWGRNIVGDSASQHQRILYRLIACFALVMCTSSPGEVEGNERSQWANSHMWNSRQDVLQGHTGIVHRVTHDPSGPTFNHDYYDPSSRELIRLVRGAHVNQIIPKIKQSFKIHPNYRKSRLKSALAEVQYVLERLVNHPKALALSATVGNLLGQPKLPVKFYQRAISLYPKRPMPHAQFGNFLVGVGEIEDGIERLKIAIKINPKLAVAYGWLALAYEKNGDSELAEEYAKKAKKKGFRGKLPKFLPKE